MKRWHLTLGLTGLALTGAYLAPRLLGMQPVQTLAEPEVVPTVMPEVVETPPVVVEEPEEPQGNLIVDAGLDKTAMLAGTQERYLTILVTAPAEGGAAVRRPVDLAVVMDTSGSMSARGKIDQARRAAKLLASSMQPGDTYSLTVFNDDATVVVPSMDVADPTAISLAIDRIYEGGGTNLYAGMDRGAREIRSNHRSGAASRVVVLSDGNANVGVTDESSMVRFAAGLAGDGVSLSTIGLGLDYNEDLLAHLADVGGGTYDFVDDASQLQTVFADELTRVSSVVARGTDLRIHLADGVTPVEVIGWDAAATSDGWSVYLGEMYAGETRKIVTKVRISERELGDRPVAEAEALYVDLVDERSATSHDDASVLVTSDVAVERASVDRERSVEVTRAVGSRLLELSTRAYADGDQHRSRRLAAEAVNTLQQGASEFADKDLARDADRIDQDTRVYEMHAPASTEGRTIIKQNKELFRDLVR
jgi:Ca-activated chloride channel family protein